ncbi:hypothetical protein QUA80_03405 [Microcoleus sp. F4-D5]
MVGFLVLFVYAGRFGKLAADRVFGAAKRLRQSIALKIRPPKGIKIG